MTAHLRPRFHNQLAPEPACLLKSAHDPHARDGNARQLGQRGWRTPGRGVRLLLAAAALAIVLAEYRTINGITAGSALLVIMVALKLVETRTHRD